MRRVLALVLFSLGAWGLMAPQANLGLAELRWMSRYVFPCESFVGMVVLGFAFYLVGHVPVSAASKEQSTNR
jgi:hypothetical protein